MKTVAQRIQESIKVNDVKIGGRTGQPRAAHRIAYEEMAGPIPEGLQIDHLCRVRHCVNPQHLEPVTPKENTRRSAVARELDRFCRNGHLRTTQNTYITPAGGVACRACHRAACVRWRATQGE